jgi:hypothetical protein
MTDVKKYVYPQDRKRAIYHRWSSMLARCYNPNNAEYDRNGALGMTVCTQWHRNNPDGYDNFAAWFVSEMEKLKDPQKRCIVLKAGETVYGPTTCMLLRRVELAQSNSLVTLIEEEVIALRALKRRQPELKLTELIQKLSLRASVPTVSKALRGLTFANLDQREAPYTQELEEVQ